MNTCTNAKVQSLTPAEIELISEAHRTPLSAYGHNRSSMIPSRAQ